MKNLLFLFLMIVGVIFVSNGIYAAAATVVIPLNSSSSGPDTATEVFNGMNNSNTDPRYCGIAGSQDGSSIHGKVFPVTRTCTIKNFTVYISSNTLSGGGCTITLQKNGVDTAISKTYTTSTAGTVDTISGEVSYSANDTFDIYAQIDGVTTGTLQFAGSFDMEY